MSRPNTRTAKEKRERMKRDSSPRQLKRCNSNHVVRGKSVLYGQDESNNLPMQHFRCLSLHHQDSPKSGDRSNWKRHGLWGQEKNSKSARLEKQLKALKDRINKQLNRLNAQYSRAMKPTRPKDVAHLLMPKSTPPLELATLSWLGDWRPSAILSLLRSLMRSSPSMAASLPYAGATERAISQLMHDLRIEEAVIDEEMAEIQANCILHLPFSPVGYQSGGSSLPQVQSELKKVHRLIVKAQNLRINALETVVKKVLCQTDAAEFLVAFAGIQETVHQFSTEYKLRKGPVSVPLSSTCEKVGVDSGYSISKFLWNE